MEQQHRSQHKDVQERRQDDLEEIQHGPFPVEQLQESGIAALDIKKLKDSGLYTVESVMYDPRKDLVQIKGISEAKVDKIIEAGLSFSVLTISCFTRCCNYAYQQTNLTNTNQQLQNWCPWGSLVQANSMRRGLKSLKKHLDQKNLTRRLLDVNERMTFFLLLYYDEYHKSQFSCISQWPVLLKLYGDFLLSSIHTFPVK
ncbi:unnamed protein product [Cuscuta campestris]|uniref:DNA recombination and repair protein Rad51-like C-terminal domain-containing protein n=1 Tax=Cuscuta campestris TaxID=132261 RepID=A0A484NBM6_9ASTE|nr:unnamed protein product [Cuscuta campestris]